MGSFPEEMNKSAIRILGIDPGEKRIGLATADDELKVATGFGVVEYRGKEQFVVKIRSIARDEEIGLIVMGLPINMNGSEGDAAKKSRNLAELLERELGIEVKLVDERLTTNQAIKQVHEAEEKVGRAREKINMLSAILILQAYLDGL